MRGMGPMPLMVMTAGAGHAEQSYLARDSPRPRRDAPTARPCPASAFGLGRAVRTIDEHEIGLVNFERRGTAPGKRIRLHQYMRGFDRVGQTVTRECQLFRSGRRAVGLGSVEIDRIHAAGRIPFEVG